ncbi:carbohydrate ABC transporter ATP-binding protein, CUT1 family [Rubellimicrobium thermophilum DSM 16684]|uniref:Carbohydrate ABC transporter ATP-binding protein, CUT1 family n=1 Tax=Rubellimicrobium thermophilum DSM 16684 TaxID=1123069 RepID=S9R1U0_9RHOB|nr:ABC transporter ATP-binding protein [Rubellimicrobium thermophilum]EPX85867.1 carbohydrate ABC transporter ATP-binding protein, CUT1 family [Rubellimicrobium thermophilum DSM 16684]
MAEIAFRNVCKSYGATVAVKDMTFTVHDNEFFCFFGPPLSGKTTILRLILGLERPDSGEILIDGRPVNGVAPAGRNIAMVFQNLALFPHMTAEENIRFPLVERGERPDRIAARVGEVARKLRIGHILHKPPALLSGGERQRVAIARALVRDPVAYLMDDPISALDARLREEARVELKRIQREAGRTLIYVTHDQEEAMSVADRMAILEEGCLSQIGTPSEIYDRPVSASVACLLGSPVMNILPLTKEGTAAGGAIRLPPVLRPQAAAFIGIRPENLHVLQQDNDEDGSCRVTDVEPLGGTTVVTVDAGGAVLRAVLRGQPDIHIGSRVTIRVDVAHVHFFGSGGEALHQHREGLA